MSADYKVHGDVAVITLNNPPVNGLGLSTRQAIVAGVEQALADPSVNALVITGHGKAFSGGADIREFGTPKAIQEPNLLSVISVIENSKKPVVAAVRNSRPTLANPAQPGQQPEPGKAGHTLPLPHRSAWREHCLARGQDRFDSWCRRHPTFASRIGRGARVEHDRQWRSHQERDAGHAAWSKTV
jgi:hypothetical protein